MRTPTRLATSAAVLLAAGAAAGPAAVAQPAGHSQERYRDLRMPDTRDVAEGRLYAQPAGPSQERYRDLRMPDTRDVAEGRLYAPTARPVVVRITRTGDPGLSWDSAGIGALAGAGLLISAAGGALVLTRRHTAHAGVR
jgi:hypothetical protein